MTAARVPSEESLEKTELKSTAKIGKFPKLLRIQFSWKTFTLDKTLLPLWLYIYHWKIDILCCTYNSLGELTVQLKNINRSANSQVLTIIVQEKSCIFQNWFLKQIGNRSIY